MLKNFEKTFNTKNLEPHNVGADIPVLMWGLHFPTPASQSLEKFF